MFCNSIAKESSTVESRKYRMVTFSEIRKTSPPKQEGDAEGFISSGQVEALEELSAASAAPAEFAASAAFAAAARAASLQERQALSAAEELRSFSQRIRPWKQ